LRRSWAFYAYAIIYGIIAFCVMLGLRALLKSGTVKLEGLGLSSVGASGRNWCGV
jgi:hypothetical protein